MNSRAIRALPSRFFAVSIIKIHYLAIAGIHRARQFSTSIAAMSFSIFCLFLVLSVEPEAGSSTSVVLSLVEESDRSLRRSIDRSIDLVRSPIDAISSTADRSKVLSPGAEIDSTPLLVRDTGKKRK